MPEDPSKDYYFIMRETGNITPLLLEYGFIDNSNDARKLQNNLNNYVEGVVKAVAEYTGYPYVSPSGETGNTYIVKAGDSLYSIASRYNTTVDELKSLNNLTSNNLSIGQVLRLPTTEVEENYTNYTVKAGDSLYKLAQTFNTTVKDLIDTNNLTSTVLSIGQVLRVPETNTEEPETGLNNYYTVVKGDSLYSIARKLGVDLDELIELNNLTNTALQIGDQLLIPGTSTNVPDENYISYTVRSGDSLYSIANRYNTTVNNIKSYNNLTSDNLSIGQIIRIPTSSTTQTTYTVKSGDSLYSIASRYNTTVDQLKSLNNLTSNLLSIGQVLRIP